MSLPVRHSRFNLAQQMMALWEEEGSYNAACVLRLRGRADVPALQSAIRIACQTAGVGRLVLDLARDRYHFDPLEAIELHEIKGGGSSAELLGRTITEQMNMPFPTAPHHPVRWLVLDDPQSNSHSLMVIWHHLTADAASILLLIRRVLNRYYGRPQPGDNRPLQVCPPDHSRVMRYHSRRLGYFRTFLRETWRYFELRHVHRMAEIASGGDGSRFHLFEAPVGLITRLAAACRARQVTVNDAFLAALGVALAEATVHCHHHSRRRALALASVVNVRPEADRDLSNAFGVYLGYWFILINEEHTRDLGDLLARIAAHTRREKANMRATAPAWNFWVVIQLKRWLSFKATRAWYRKVYPLSAGLSHVKLNASWFKGANEHLLDFIGIAPTGPAIPMVLSSVRLRDRLNLCLAYHPPSLPDSEAHRLMDRFLRNLATLAGGGNSTAGDRQ